MMKESTAHDMEQYIPKMTEESKKGRLACGYGRHKSFVEYLCTPAEKEQNCLIGLPSPRHAGEVPLFLRPLKKMRKIGEDQGPIWRVPFSRAGWMEDSGSGQTLKKSGAQKKESLALSGWVTQGRRAAASDKCTTSVGVHGFHQERLWVWPTNASTTLF